MPIFDEAEAHKLFNEIAGACACLGPQNGEPFCPCEMRRIVANQSVLEREIWNKAIEAAAQLCENRKSELPYGFMSSIRSLKK